METGFPSLEDTDLQYLLLKEFCDRYYPLLEYTQLDKVLSVHDEVHDEVHDGDKVWKEAVQLRAYVVPAAQAYPLTVFGIEELRDAVLQVSVPNLLAVELATRDESSKVVELVATVGDRFTFNDELYEVLVWRIGQTFANTDVPLLFAANCVKVHFPASPYQGL